MKYSDSGRVMSSVTTRWALVLAALSIDIRNEVKSARVNANVASGTSADAGWGEEGRGVDGDPGRGVAFREEATDGAARGAGSEGEDPGLPESAAPGRSMPASDTSDNLLFVNGIPGGGETADGGVTSIPGAES
jgi:hypothetical protein